jgi:hypothetical protein
MSMVRVWPDSAFISSRTVSANECTVPRPDTSAKTPRSFAITELTPPRNCREVHQLLPSCTPVTSAFPPDSSIANKHCKPLFSNDLSDFVPEVRHTAAWLPVSARLYFHHDLLERRHDVHLRALALPNQMGQTRPENLRRECLASRPHVRGIGFPFGDGSVCANHVLSPPKHPAPAFGSGCPPGMVRSTWHSISPVNFGLGPRLESFPTSVSDFSANMAFESQG